MANTTPSPNMNMPVPTVAQDPGPDWASNLDACLSILDQHNHSTGQGVPVTPSGLLINTDLTMNSNNLTNAKSVRFASQSAPLSGPSDIGCLYESLVDLYYNDGAGNQIRITQSGALAGAAGTITGLPSGTASASFSSIGGGRFTFNAATATPANMTFGPASIGLNSASPKFVTLTPNGAQPSDYSLVFPPSLPAALNYMTLDSSGNISFNSSGTTGTGAVVLAASPTLSGTVGGSFTLSGIIQANGGMQVTATTSNTTSTSTTLSISNNPHFIFTGLIAASTVNLPTTSVKAGNIWIIENTSTDQPLTLQASDSSALTFASNGIDCTITPTIVQPISRAVVMAKIDTPVTNTDWVILDVIDSGTWSGTTSGAISTSFYANMTRRNNQVTVNARCNSGNPSGTSITASGMPARARPQIQNFWAPCIVYDATNAVAGMVQVTTAGDMNFFLAVMGSFSNAAGFGGFNGSGSPNGTSFSYNIYNPNS